MFPGTYEPPAAFDLDRDVLRGLIWQEMLAAVRRAVDWLWTERIESATCYKRMPPMAPFLPGVKHIGGEGSLQSGPTGPINRVEEADLVEDEDQHWPGSS